MKKHVLTLAAASVLAANAAVAADVTVYGKANVSLQSTTVEQGSATSQDNWELMSNASRIGVKGSADLNDGLKAVYKFEYETYLDDGEKNANQTLKQRNIYVGLKGGFGTIMAGMHDTPTKMLGKPVDIFSDLSLADIKNVVEGENRQKNMIMYKSNDLSGFKINAMIVPGEEDGGDAADSDTRDGIADGTSVSINYKANGLSAGVSVDGDIDNRDTTRFVVAYGQKAWGVSALFQTAEEVDRAGTEEETGMIFTGHYKTGNWKLKALVGQADIEEDGAADVEVSQLVLGADYKLGKKTKTFIYHASVESEADGADAEEKTTFGIGLEHKF